MILYLDFDGVLHHEDVRYAYKKGIYMAMHGRTLFEWEPILVDLLAPHPDVRIVLSTSWVHAKSFHYACNRLVQALRDRVIGATFHKGLMDRVAFAAMPRGLQIWGDVLRRRPDDWFALDDDHVGWPSWCRDKLIWTDENIGLSKASTQQAIRALLSERKSST